MSLQNDNLGADLPEQRLARLLLTGQVGFDLYDALTEQFPDIPRASVYLAIALAWTDREAALLAAEAELADLERRSGARRAA